MKIKKGDQVYIAKGKDRGKSGKITLVLPSKNAAVIQGLNQYKKTVKPKKQGEKGQIILVSRPISAANLRLVCSKCGHRTKVGYKIENKKKNRYCKKCQSVV